MSFTALVVLFFAVVSLLGAVYNIVAVGRYASPVMGLKNLSFSFIFTGILVYVLRQENLAKQEGLTWGNVPDAAYLAPQLAGIALMVIAGGVTIWRSRRDD